MTTSQPTKSTPLSTYDLHFGETYVVRVPDTQLLFGGDADEPVTLERTGKAIVARVGRKTNDVALVVTSDKAESEHWAAALPLPELFDV